MNHEKWALIKNYNFDKPVSVYGFSTRLAYENKWTLGFTQLAILEYKKFMFLASESGQMVSPSPVVDIVWHQHLIFTNSYTDFCNILGKRIEHIPSTHNVEEKTKFANAASQTKEFYHSCFGEQPEEIWGLHSYNELLEKDKSYFSEKYLRFIFIFVFIILVYPFALLFEPVYHLIENPYFLIFYSISVVGIVFYLKYKNKKFYQSLVENICDEFIYKNLTPSEIGFIKHDGIHHLIKGSVNQMLLANELGFDRKGFISAGKFISVTNAFHFTIYSIVKDKRMIAYQPLFLFAKKKPVFLQVQLCMKNIRESFLQSKAHINNLFFTYLFLLIPFLFGFGRLITGISNDKPVGLIIAVLLLFIFVIYTWFSSIGENVFKDVLTDELIKRKINSSIPDNDLDWELKYMKYGDDVLWMKFVPLARSVTDSYSGDALWLATCGTSCGSSCGSSCGGGGCGGCGGGD